MATKNDFRKRYLVTEGDLFTLYREVMQIRSTELREQYYRQFRQLLREAHEVKLTIVEPGTTNDGGL
jgi:hypothetical protein